MAVNTQCSVAGCDRTTRGGGRGWCHAHYEWSRSNEWAEPTHEIGAADEPECSVPVCERPARQRDMCGSHYAWSRDNDWAEPTHEIGTIHVRGKCSVEDCDRPHSARGYCGMHYSRWRRGDDMHRPVSWVGHGMTGTPEHLLWKKAKERAQRNEMEFTLHVSDIHIPDRCPYLGIPLEPGDGKQHSGSPSLDRIDPSKGYTPENTIVVSYRANGLKGDATPSELRRLADAIERAMELQQGDEDERAAA